MRSFLITVLLAVGAAILVVFWKAHTDWYNQNNNQLMQPMEKISLTSTAFSNGGTIPALYTCDGSNVNPPLTIGTVPLGTKSLALIVDDPDAPMGAWTHWIVWNISPATLEIKEQSVPKGAVQGLHSGKRVGYTGPCPPTGSHRYFFKIYALDTALEVPSLATADELVRAFQGHVLGYGELMGRYQRMQK